MDQGGDGPVSSRTRSKTSRQIEEPNQENEPEERNPLERNPFLMPPVLRYVLKFVETPDLRGLRRISSLWDTMVLAEMETRARKGEYPDLGFEWNHYWKSLNADPMKNFANFFRSTTTCPNLFGSFDFEFPGSPLVLNLAEFTTFFEIYNPRQVKLALPSNFNFTEDANARNLLRGFALRMAPTLEELTISKAGSVEGLPQIPEQGSVEELLFPNLEKLTLGHSDSNQSDGSATSAFTTLFGQGNCQMPKLTHLEIFSFFGYLDDLFAINLVDPIRWRSLTTLSIQIDSDRFMDDDEMIKFMDGLMFLGRSGMALMELTLEFELEGQISHQVFGNLTQFLQNQSQSLETLTLYLHIYASEQDDEELDLDLLPRITLPHCPCLKSLDMSSQYYRFMEETNEYMELFNLISLPNNFPILESLSLSCPCVTTLALLRKHVDPAERRHLEVFEFDSTNWTHVWSEEDNAHLLNNFSTVGEIKINN